MVDVSSQNNSVSINVSSSGNSASIKASPDTAQYYSEKSREYAISDKLIDGKDYSSKYYANKSALSETSAKNYADASQTTYTNVQNVANEALTDIETARVDAVDNITTVKSESIASVEAKGNEANTLVNTGIANINTAKTEAVNAVTTTKNNAVTEINKEVTDGKKELNDIIEAGGLNINDKITNCLLEVPQRIKYTLENGTLTIKAGSVAIFPYGTTAPTYNIGDTIGTNGRWKVADIHYQNNTLFYSCELLKDTVVPGTSTAVISDKRPVFPSLYNAGFPFVFYPENMVTSGTEALTANGVRYLTNSNIVGRYISSGWNASEGMGFPVCVAQGAGVAGGGFASVDQVFNGFGYIGSTVWVDKGVKGLIPNGRNEDGSLKNIEYTTTSVNVRSVGLNGWDCTYAVLNNNKIVDYKTLVVSEIQPTITNTLWYKPNENLLYTTANGTPVRLYGFPALDCYRTNTTISNFNPKLPFRAVDWNDIKKLHVNNPYFFGMYQWFERDPQNLSWLKSSGQWNSGSGYQAFYDWALANTNANKAGFKLSTASYTDYDFVVNKSNKTFRLPIKVQNTPMGGTAPVLAGETINEFDTVLRWRNADLSVTNSTNVILGLYASTNNTSGTGCGGTQSNQTLFQALAPANLYADLSNATNSNLSLYFYVGETVRDEFLIDVGQIASNFADKIGRTECKAYITETYSSGTSWYRVWSDGWKEQGGVYDNGSAIRDKNGINVKFLKAFKDANYIITPFAYKNDNAPEYRTAVANVYYKTATQATMGWYGTDGNQKVRYLNWYACGY